LDLRPVSIESGRATISTTGSVPPQVVKQLQGWIGDRKLIVLPMRG
jgi:hypothetical protein